MTVAIPLSRGAFALVDDEDVSLVRQFRWFCHSVGYACRTVRINGARSDIYMHRLILNAPDGLEVDHINHNGLDNRRANLRIANHTQNMQNQGPRNSLGLKGVSSTNKTGRYRARIRVNGPELFLGYFDTPEEAARAYDTAARHYHGVFARCNFPEVPA